VQFGIPADTGGELFGSEATAGEVFSAHVLQTAKLAIIKPTVTVVVVFMIFDDLRKKLRNRSLFTPLTHS
jgi:hypothetical protein